MCQLAYASLFILKYYSYSFVTVIFTHAFFLHIIPSNNTIIVNCVIMNAWKPSLARFIKDCFIDKSKNITLQKPYLLICRLITPYGAIRLDCWEQRGRLCTWTRGKSAVTSFNVLRCWFVFAVILYKRCYNVKKYIFCLDSLNISQCIHY